MANTRTDRNDIYKDLEKAKQYLTSLFSGAKRKQIESAIQYAEGVLDGSKRLNGDPTVSHSFMVGLKTAQMNLGPNSISAAILHDLIEDHPDRSDIPKDIEKKFGKDVYNLVWSLTLINSNPAEKSPTPEVEAARQYLVATVSDLRVIMVKLADKIHNIMTIEGLPPDRKKRYMDEVERIYLPISEYMGLGSIHREIDDLLLEKRQPKLYRNIVEYINAQSPINEETVENIIEELKAICDTEGMPVTIEGRVKGIASISRKLKKYKKEMGISSLDFIRDFVAFRILTDTEESCYAIFSTLNQIYDVETEHTKDYIAEPKSNGYRSIHLILDHN